jgi:putative transposase
VESFFGHLKEEFHRRRHFASIAEFVQELGTYIHWYNHIRIKEKLNGLSPVQYRSAKSYVWAQTSRKSR